MIAAVLGFCGGVLVGGAVVWLVRSRQPEGEAGATGRVPLEVYRTVFAASRDGLYLLDDKQRYVEVNPAWLEQIGCKRYQVVGQRFGNQRTLGRELQSASPKDFARTTMVGVRRSSFDRSLEMSCVNVEVGGRTYTLGRARDISERERTLARLERFQAAVDAATDGLAVIDDQGRLLYANAAARVWLQGSELLERIESQARKSGDVEFELRVQQRVGVVQVSPCGHGVIACVRDVTGERRQESRRQAAESRLHELQRMRSLGVLAGRLAHTFNNLLTSIHGFTELARGRTEDPKVQRHLDRVLKASNDASTLTRQLRQFSSGRAGEFRRIDVQELLLDLETPLRGILGDQIQLTLQVDDDELPVLGDAAQLRQLLLNLALRVSGESDELVRRGAVVVRLRSRWLDDGAAVAHGLTHGGQYCQIEVEDDLAPLSHDEGLRAFEPFSVDSAGLGLPAVYGIAMRHGGAIQVAPSATGGAHFTLMLPVDTHTVEATSELPDARVATLTGVAILVIDDEELILELASSVLRGAGMRVETASTGEAGLALLADPENHYDMLLSDVVLPGKSGIQVVAEARDLRPTLPAMLMTGYSAHRPAPGIPVLEKPFAPQELLNRVGQLLVEAQR